MARIQTLTDAANAALVAADAAEAGAMRAEPYCARHDYFSCPFVAEDAAAERIQRSIHDESVEYMRAQYAAAL